MGQKMKIGDEYSHKNALLILSTIPNIYNEIKSVISRCDYLFGKHNPELIKKYFSDEFNSLGWADRVRLNKKSNLTVSFIKDRVGVCIQLGNVARTYADILKLSYLAKQKKIKVGIIIVPDQKESKLLGANYASFNRLIREIDLFSEIIESPILVLSLST
jgi:hypothetical protein